MFSQVPGNNQDQFIETVKIGDLSMRTYNITVHHADEPELPESSDRTPVCSFTTPWLERYSGLFRVNVTIIGPKPEEPEGYLSLTSSHFNEVLEAITNLVELLEEKLR